MASGVELATAYVSLVVEGSEVAPGVRKALGGADTEARRTGEKAGRSYTAAFGKKLALGTALAGAFAATKGVQLVSSAIGAASDLNESLNAVNVTFGKSAQGIKDLGADAADALGLSNVEFNALAVRFSAFARTVAGKGGSVVRTMDDLTTRAADFASVMNLEVAEAAELFQSGLAGETEPLRKFGIDLSAAAVEAHAYAEGIAETGAKLTEAEKVQSRYSLLMEQTAKTQGDFSNTSDELANVQRRLNASWTDSKAALGQAFLPLAEQATRFLLNEGIPAFNRFSDWFTKEGAPAIADFGDDIGPLAKELLPAIGDALGVVKDALAGAAPLAKDFVGAFRGMPDWAQALVVGGGAAAIAIPKIKNSSGLLGTAASAFSKTKPLPVFVVNQGFGAAGGGVPGGGGKPPKGGGKFPGGLGWLGALPIALPALGALGNDTRMLEAIPKSLEKINQALVDIAVNKTGMTDLSKAVGTLDKEFARLTKRSPEDGLRRFNSLAAQTGLSVADLSTLLPKTAAQIDKTGARADDAAGRTDRWMESILGANSAVDKVDGRKPRVQFEMPGLLDAITDTLGLTGNLNKIDGRNAKASVIVNGLDSAIRDTTRMLGNLLGIDGFTANTRVHTTYTRAGRPDPTGDLAPGVTPRSSGGTRPSSSYTPRSSGRDIADAVYRGARDGIAARGVDAYIARRA